MAATVARMTKREMKSVSICFLFSQERGETQKREEVNTMKILRDEVVRRGRQQNLCLSFYFPLEASQNTLHQMMRLDFWFPSDR